MPRAIHSADTEAEETTPPKRVRRAPRKRVESVASPEREVVSETSPMPTPVRRKAPVRRVVAPAPVTEAPPSTSVSEVTPKRRLRGGRRMQWIVVLALLLFGIGGSVLIGISDKGKIDVAARIQQQNQTAADQARDSGGMAQTIPVQNTPVNVPNGGLIPAGAAAPAPVPVPEPVATATATTTGNATSTDTAVLGVATSTNENSAGEVATTSEAVQ